MSRKNTALWLGALSVGLVGDQLYFIALAWATLEIASPADVGIVLAAASIPRAIFLLGGGAFADRLGPKRAAMIGSIGRLAILGIGATVLLCGLGSIPALIAVGVGFGVFDALFLPAISAMQPLLVPPGGLARLQAARALVQRGSVVIGAPLAGLMVAGVGVPLTFAINVPAAALAALLLWFVRVPRFVPTIEQDGSPARFGSGVWRSIWDGLRYVGTRRDLLVLLVIVSMADFGFVGPAHTGLPILATERGWGPAGVGMILGAFGVGAAAAAGWILLGKGPKGPIRLACLALLGGAPALAGLGLASDLGWTVLFALILGWCGSVCGTLLTTAVMASTSVTHMGRVMSVLALASYGLLPVSYLLTGVAAAWNPTSPFLFGAMLAAAAGIGGLLSPTLRRRKAGR